MLVTKREGELKDIVGNQRWRTADAWSIAGGSSFSFLYYFGRRIFIVIINKQYLIKSKSIRWKFNVFNFVVEWDPPRTIRPNHSFHVTFREVQSLAKN